MKKYICTKLMILLTLFVCVGTSYAYVPPSTQEKAREYDRKLCVAHHHNICVNAVCMTSEERDCHQTCREGATAKCDEIEDESTYR